MRDICPVTPAWRACRHRSPLPLGRGRAVPASTWPGPVYLKSAPPQEGGDQSPAAGLSHEDPTRRERREVGDHTAVFVHRSSASPPPTFDWFLNYLCLPPKAQGASPRGTAPPSHQPGGAGEEAGSHAAGRGAFPPATARPPTRGSPTLVKSQQRGKRLQSSRSNERLPPSLATASEQVLLRANTCPCLSGAHDALGLVSYLGHHRVLRTSLCLPARCRRPRTA